MIDLKLGQLCTQDLDSTLSMLKEYGMTTNKKGRLHMIMHIAIEHFKITSLSNLYTIEQTTYSWSLEMISDMPMHPKITIIWII